MKNIFHVKLMEILQLAQPDVVRTVYLLVWTGTRQLFFLFPAFEHGENMIWAFCNAICWHSFFRKVMREEQQRILLRTSLQKRLWLSCQLSKLKLCSSQKCLFRLTSKRKMRAGQGV